MIKELDKSLGALEKIVEDLEKGDQNLAQSLALFEKGIGLTKQCQTALDEADQQVEILTKELGKGDKDDA